MLFDRLADRKAEVGLLFGIRVDPLVAFLFDLDRGKERAVLLFDPADIGDGIAAVRLFINFPFQPEVEGIHQDEGETDIPGLSHILAFSIFMPNFANWGACI